MKKKLLGVMLMSSALLLQVGYAMSTTMPIPHTVVNTQAFDVYFLDPTITQVDEYMTIDVTEGTHPNEAELHVNVSNLYPGGQFELTTGVENKGIVDAKITGIDIHVEEGLEGERDKTYNKMLLDKLVGYDEGGNVYKGEVAYEEYLIEAYEEEVIKSGSSIPIQFSMGLDYEEKSFQNEEVAFSIQMTLGQVTDTTPDGENDDSDNDDSDDNDDDDTDGGESQEPEITIPDEEVPGGGTTTPTDVPQGPEDSTTTPEDSTTTPGDDVGVPEGEENNPDIEIPDETVPGGPVLPKTGGLTPIVVYGLGAVMMMMGLVCYGKKDVKKNIRK